jgi:hypothetical protein
LIQDRSVNAAKISIEFQIAVIEIGQARIFPVQAGFDCAAEHKHRRSRAMIGPAICVLAHAPAEFAERQ